MIVDFTSQEPFHGRIYANGYTENCGVEGTGDNETTLLLPLLAVKDLSTGNIGCGITPAYAIDNENR